MRKGRLFGGRYRQAACLDEAYVLAVSLYIHLNPVRAGLAAKPTDYRWSSCWLFTKADITSTFVTADWILQWLSPDPEEARDMYNGMLDKGKWLKLDEVMENSGAIHRLQGKLNKVMPQFGQLRIMRKQLGPETQEWFDLEKTMAAFIEGENVPLPRTKAASKYMVEQLISRGFTRKEIAQRIGISRKTIYNLLRRPTVP
jgi:putative transposase